MPSPTAEQRTLDTKKTMKKQDQEEQKNLIQDEKTPAGKYTPVEMEQIQESLYRMTERKEDLVETEEIPDFLRQKKMSLGVLNLQVTMGEIQRGRRIWSKQSRS